jgi:hypothetical protein
MILAIFIIIVAVFSIAATSIGIQCFSEKNDTTSSNYKFLIANLVLSIILVLICVGGIYPFGYFR